jgi:hypothetical protein
VDVIAIEPDGASIKIDVIRDVLTDMFRPFEGRNAWS